jgi:hypothetical protein
MSLKLTEKSEHRFKKKATTSLKQIENSEDRFANLSKKIIVILDVISYALDS